MRRSRSSSTGGLCDIILPPDPSHSLDCKGGEQSARFPQRKLANHSASSGNDHCNPFIARVVKMLTKTGSHRDFSINKNRFSEQ